MLKFMGRAAAARELKLTPQRVWELARAGVLPVAAEIDQCGRVERVFSRESVEQLRREREARAA